MSLLNQITEEIKAAMKAKDRVALEALRGIKKELIEASTAKGADDELSEEAGMKILQKMVKQRKDAAAIFIEQGREDLAEKENSEVEVISRFLPEQITGEKLEALVAAIVEKSGAQSIKEMGKVMGMASKELGGKADGKEIADAVKKILSA
ncbi:GatB/YqeY domain-containing protein [Plebeiibacterium sediminum]|uniref:GatB/YqeY domain-containing protein n=1 Tax=Plebeiibacterium sediminum TaxID=2992112 RepID=A0AAE3M7E5_9BACT|nr:GatB/YqeY domain-containing protein [Plebeiobacterium sediminum]MCW3788392.1 GatB/YqeY domain-containing protein [Plebeiobacterium sediminum]